MGPCHQLIEGFADLILPNSAVAIAVDVLLDQVLAEARGFDLAAVEGEL
jgi:hypothetical protein